MAQKLEISTESKMFTIEEMEKITEFARNLGFRSSYGYRGRDAIFVTEANFTRDTIHGEVKVRYIDVTTLPNPFDRIKYEGFYAVEIIWVSCKTTDAISIESLNDAIKTLEGAKAIYEKLVA